MKRWRLVSVGGRTVYPGVLGLAAIFAVIVAWCAPACGSGVEADPADGGYRIVRGYDSFLEAEAYADSIGQADGRARVREQSRHIRLFNLRIGTYAGRLQAHRAQQHLQNRDIDSQLLGDAVDGYFLSVGAFSERANAKLLRRKLEAMGFDNTFIVPISVVQRHYVVEKRVVPTPESVPVPVSDTPDASSPDHPALSSLDGPYDGGTAKPAARAIPTLQDSLPSNVHLGAGMDTLRMETGWLTDLAEPVTGSHYLRASAHTQVKIGYRWEFRLGGRVDGYYQQGSPAVSHTQVDYAPSYVRYDGLNTRITAGAQRVIWGRMDSFPPNDRLSVQDISRFVLYRMSWRRRAVPELRVEQYFGSAFKADLLWQPWFRPAKLPAANSIWSPVDKTRGRIISVRPQPRLFTVHQRRHVHQGHRRGGWCRRALQRHGEVRRLCR